MPRITRALNWSSLCPQAIGEDGVGVLEARRAERIDVRKPEVIAYQLLSRCGMGDVDAIAGIIGKTVVDDAIPWLGERAHMHNNVEHLLRRIIVLFPNEGIDVSDVGLGILLDEWGVAVACGPGRYPEKCHHSAADQQSGTS